MKNNTNNPILFFLLFLLLFLPSSNSFCTITLLTPVAHAAAEHSPADGGKGSEERKSIICCSLQVLSLEPPLS